MALTREDFARLLDDPAEARRHTGRFACFQMIPVEERIGQWRFAGTADNLADAFERCGGLFNRVWPREQPLTGTAILRDLLDVLELSGRPWSAGSPAEFELEPSATLVLLAEGGAPRDDVATAIFEVGDWGELQRRPIEDQVPASPHRSAYVLELFGAMANNNGDPMGFAFVERDLAALRLRFEALCVLPLRFELSTAICLELGGGDPLVLRVWTIQRGVAGAPLDVRPFVRVQLEDTCTTLDALGVFEDANAFPSEHLEVKVLWDAVESALAPLQEPVLEADGELGFQHEAEVAPHFFEPLQPGENIIEP